MNTRMRVKALPAILATSLGVTLLGGPAKVLANHAVLARAAQPEGFEEINLTVEEGGVTGMPERVAAGRYLVKVTGPEMSDMGPSGFMIVQLPDGITPEQAYEDTMAAVDSVPEWFTDVHFGGGFALVQGTEGWAVLDLTPGQWYISTPYFTTAPVGFEVTGEFPTDVAEPEANVALDMFEMDFKVTEGEFVAGENVVTLHNSGAQIHFIEMMKVPDGTTDEQVEGLFNSFMTGTPEPGALQQEDTTPAFFAPDQSPEVSQTLPITLEAGTYLLVCWVADPETGMPHAMMGMHELVTVSE